MLTKVRLVVLVSGLILSTNTSLAQEVPKQVDDLAFGQYSGSDADSTWLQLDNKARADIKEQNYSQAQKGFKEAIAYAESKNLIAPGLINSLLGLTLTNEKLGNRDEAERIYELAMRYAESTYGPTSAAYAAFLADLAWLYHFHNKDDKGEILFLRAIKTFENAFGEGSAQEVVVLREYQIFLKEAGRVAESEKIQHRLDRIKGSSGD